MEKLLLIVLVFSSWLIGFSTPSISESRMSKDIYSKSPNSLNKSNTTRTESSLDKISELGLLLTSCPFVLKKNEMHGRIPSMFYEVECLTCKSCSKNGSKSRCTQLVTEMEATFVSKNGDNSWTEAISVKAGCTCAAVLRRQGNIRP